MNLLKNVVIALSLFGNSSFAQVMSPNPTPVDPMLSTPSSEPSSTALDPMLVDPVLSLSAEATTSDDTTDCERYRRALKRYADENAQKYIEIAKLRADILMYQIELANVNALIIKAQKLPITGANLYYLQDLFKQKERLELAIKVAEGQIRIATYRINELSKLAQFYIDKLIELGCEFADPTQPAPTTVPMP
jgi:hypothetical protein